MSAAYCTQRLYQKMYPNGELFGFVHLWRLTIVEAWSVMRGGSCRRERVVYSLQRKGARVMTGRNMDDDGSQSNASGKSSLVMAPLWALTGRSDARAEVCGVS